MPEDERPSLVVMAATARVVCAVTGVERYLCVRAGIYGTVTCVGAVAGIAPVIPSIIREGRSWRIAVAEAEERRNLRVGAIVTRVILRVRATGIAREHSPRD